MGKRTVTRVGDIFCVDLDGKYKRYFQYVAKDEQELGSAVIQIFRRRYPLDYEPALDEIVNDEVVYNLHTFVQIGVKMGIWYKIGTSKQINQCALDQAIFGSVFGVRSIHKEDGLLQETFQVMKVDPLENWRLWGMSFPAINNVTPPIDILDKITVGAVLDCNSIVDWMRFGYFRGQGPIFSLIKRIPWDYVDSYAKLPDGNSMVYYHFHGEKAVREIIIPENGRIIKLSKERPESNGWRLRTAKFWETNWERENFITEEEFNSLWEG